MIIRLKFYKLSIRRWKASSYSLKTWSDAVLSKRKVRCAIPDVCWNLNNEEEKNQEPTIEQDCWNKSSAKCREEDDCCYFTFLVDHHAKLTPKSDQKSSSLWQKSYPAIEMMFPKEKRIANLAGLPVARLKNDPKDSSWMIYPILDDWYRLRHR